MSALPHMEHQGLLDYDSGEDADGDLDLDELDEEKSPSPAFSAHKTQEPYDRPRSSQIRQLPAALACTFTFLLNVAFNFVSYRKRRPQPIRSSLRTRRCWTHWIIRLMCIAVASNMVPILLCGLFFPSYTRPPQHYDSLRKRITSAQTPGAANSNNEKVFIAAALYDPGGDLVRGDWAESIKGLIHILGPENIHLSIFENDADMQSQAALYKFGKELPCNASIVEEELDYTQLPHVMMPDGSRRLKRMTFLAEVRNKALQPLIHSEVQFDKILYVNDVIFDPIDAANLLFSTNVDESGQAQYHAACAIDFGNPFKFYDTFATRDTEGFEAGVIFYPWFASAGQATSRNDVLAQKDAVRVRSCWGGMVAFEARWFQDQRVPGADTTNVQLPLRFRAENDSYWDASECCLIHADLAALTAAMSREPEIYMNPYIRVAYSKRVLDWLPITRRFERLYPPFQSLVNWIAGMPRYNPRRLEQPGQKVTDKVWVWDEATRAAIQAENTMNLPRGLQGTFKNVERMALPGSFCGGRSLSTLIVNASSGEKHWVREAVPDGG